jgi:HEPN domain-containing protein
MKAFLTWHDIPFRRTHNLVELLEQCSAIDPALASLRESAAFLTGFAVDARYPGTLPEPDASTAQEALQRAREFSRLILDQLPPEAQT